VKNMLPTPATKMSSVKTNHNFEHSYFGTQPVNRPVSSDLQVPQRDRCYMTWSVEGIECCAS
jgi:hypothetical protein